MKTILSGTIFSDFIGLFRLRLFCQGKFCNLRLFCPDTFFSNWSINVPHFKIKQTKHNEKSIVNKPISYKLVSFNSKCGDHTLIRIFMKSYWPFRQYCKYQLIDVVCSVLVFCNWNGCHTVYGLEIYIRLVSIRSSLKRWHLITAAASSATQNKTQLWSKSIHKSFFPWSQTNGLKKADKTVPDEIVPTKHRGRGKHVHTHCQPIIR